MEATQQPGGEIGIRPGPSMAGRLEKDFYDVDEAAERLGLHRATVLNQIRKGHLRAKKIFGAAGFRITREAIQEWLDS